MKLRSLLTNVNMKIAQIVFLALVISMSGLAGSQETSTSEPQQALDAAVTQAQYPASPPDVPLGQPLDEWSLAKDPKQARKLNLQGHVALILHVDEKGKVKDVSALSGDPELIKAATNAAKKWSYLPYEVSGKPVPVTTKILVRFSIPENGSAEVAVEFEVPDAPFLGPIYKLGRGIISPKPLNTENPKYSQQARNDRFQGSDTLEVIIGSDGRTYDIKVTRPLGEGLDERAIEAVQGWRFEPARKDGKPVAVAVTLQTEFHLQ